MVSFFEKNLSGHLSEEYADTICDLHRAYCPTSGHGRRLNEWERAIAFAKEEGYETAEFLFNKNGCAVYEPVMKVGEILLHRAVTCHFS